MGPESKRSSNRLRLWRRAARALWGFDFFVSYRWNSGGLYAVELAERLRDRRFDCFLDRSEFAVGDDWKEEAERALRNTRRLLIIATREAITESDAVRHELEIFTSRSDRVIPIVFGERFSEDERRRIPALAALPDSTVDIVEDPARLDKGPSEEVLDKIEQAHRLVRRRTVRGGVVLAAMLALTLAAGGAALFWLNAERQKQIAVASWVDSQRELARNLIDRGVRAIREGDATGLFYLLRAYEIAERHDAPAGERVSPDDPISTSARRLMTGAGSSVGIGLLHGEELYPGALSPRGDLVRTKTANIDGEPTAFHFWDAATGRPLEPPFPIDDEFSNVFMSSDWSRAVHWNGARFRHQDVRTGEVRDVPSEELGRRRAFHPFGYSPDGLRYASADAGAVELWNTETGQRLHRVAAGFDAIRSMTFSANGRLLLVEPGDETGVQVIDVDAGQPRGQRIAPSSKVVHAELSPDGERLATVDAHRTVQLWDVHAAQAIGPPREFPESNPDVSFAPAGAALLLRAGPELLLLDPRTGADRDGPPAQPGRLVSADFSSDGRWLVTAGEDRTDQRRTRAAEASRVGVWDLHEQRIRIEFRHREGRVVSARFSPDAALVLVEDEDGLQLYDAKSGRRRGGPWRSPRNTIAIAFAPDGRSVRSLTHADRSASIHHFAPPAEVFAVREGTTLSRLAPSGERLLTVADGTAVQLWDTGTGEPIGDGWEHPEPIERARFSADGRWILTEGGPADIRVWSAETGSLQFGPETGPERDGASFLSEDGRLVIAGDETVYVWDFEGGKLVKRGFPPPDDLQLLSLSPDGTRVITTGLGDALVKILDARSGAVVREFDAQSGVIQNLHEPETFTALVFTPSGDEALTLSTYGAIRLWDVDTGRLLREFREPTSEVGVGAAGFADDGIAAFSSDGRLLATGHGETARLWSVPTGHLVQELHGHARFEDIESIAFSSDDRFLVTSAPDAVYRWPIPQLPDEPERIRAWVEVRSLAEWSENGALSPIGHAAWLSGWQRLIRLGGPF